MNTKIYFIVAYFLFCFSTTKVERPNFSGIWNLNISKSQFGTVDERAAVKYFDITQTNDSIIMKRVILNNDKSIDTLVESISLNGELCTDLLQNKRTRVSKIIWPADTKEMTIVRSYSLPDNSNKIDYVLSQTWSLENKSKSLTIKLSSPNYFIVAVYDKSN